MKKGSRVHKDYSITQYIKDMSITSGSSMISESSKKHYLNVPSQQIVLHGQIDNMSNINHMRQKSPVPKSSSAH